jgi:hypothetical protein
MKYLLPIATVVLTFNQAFAACIPARVEVDYPEDAPSVGMYHRVHPSGNYVLGSGIFSGETGVGIIDLTAKDADGNITAKAIQTPMINETYPVEGNWSHLASPLHNDGMRYYKFDEILDKKKDAKPVMNDPDHNNWYHSAAELPGSTPENFKFRTMLYGNSYRDYELSYKKDGKLKDSTESKTKYACQNLTSSLNSPILSKDGTEVAANVGNQTVIYKINDDATCELVESLGFYTSKVNFSYPKPPKKGQIVFKGSANIMVDGVPKRASGVFMYDRDTKVTTRLSSGNDEEPSYPGMTLDGRVIYQDIRSRKIVIIDPNQLKADGTESSDKSKCIQVAGPASGAPATPAAPAPAKRGTRQ